MPGGALGVIEAGGLERRRPSCFALHCDPSLDVGKIGLRTGAITSASDHVEVGLTGPGGHTARPHLTVDLVYALGAVVDRSPACWPVGSIRRSAVTLVWGQVNAGAAANAIPRAASPGGRSASSTATPGRGCPPSRARDPHIVAPYGADVEVTYIRGVPPVVNDGSGVACCAGSRPSALGRGGCGRRRRALGGEDFGWYLEQVPGAMARLGVRSPGSTVSSTCTSPGSTSTSAASGSASGCWSPPHSPPAERSSLRVRGRRCGRGGCAGSARSRRARPPPRRPRRSGPGSGPRAARPRTRRGRRPRPALAVERRDPHPDLVVEPGVGALPASPARPRRAATGRRAPRRPAHPGRDDRGQRAVPAELLAAERQPPAVEPAGSAAASGGTARASARGPGSTRTPRREPQRKRSH